MSDIWQGSEYVSDVKGKNKSKKEFLQQFPCFAGNCAFPQNFHTKKLGEITVFFAVWYFQKNFFIRFINVKENADWQNYFPLIPFLQFK